jgi:hypothetical protein
MLYLKLTHSDGERELNLSAEDLSEMIEKIKDWNSWKKFMDVFPLTSRYKANPEKEVKEESESGWYWFD